MNINIQTERIILRDFKEDDYDFYFELESDELTIAFESDLKPTRQELEGRFEEIMLLAKKKKREKYSLLVERKEDSIPIGRVVIWQIDESIDEWELGWTIYSDYIRNGFASEASKELIKFGFDKLGANRICANSNDANVASEKVMQKIGMTKEGVLRETRKLNNRWYGSIIYSVLSSEFIL